MLSPKLHNDYNRVYPPEISPSMPLLLLNLWSAFMTKSTQSQKSILPLYSWDIPVIIPCWIWLFISFKSACSFGFPGTVFQGFLILPRVSFSLPSPHTPVHATPQWFLQMLDLCPSSAFIPTGPGTHNGFRSSYRHSPLYLPIYGTVLSSSGEQT